MARRPRRFYLAELSLTELTGISLNSAVHRRSYGETGAGDLFAEALSFFASAYPAFASSRRPVFSRATIPAWPPSFS